jgi:hypothetical protein
MNGAGPAAMLAPRAHLPVGDETKAERRFQRVLAEAHFAVI